MRIYNKTINDFLDNLHEGKVILYPTDTIWWIGWDATSSNLIQKVADLKYRSMLQKKWFVTLIHPNHIEQFTDYSSQDVLNKYHIHGNTPLTFEIQKAKNLPDNLNVDGFVAMRIPFQCPYLMEILEKFGKPIISTSANTSWNPFPSTFSKIEPRILNGSDYIVHRKLDNWTHKPSTIISFEEGRLFRE